MSASVRETPFALVMGTMAPERFPILRDGILAAGRDPRDRHAFLMVREVVELLRDIEPEEGLGEGIGTMAAFLHHGYLYWLDGSGTIPLTDAVLDAGLSSADQTSTAAPVGSARYIQLPPLKVWGEPVAGGPAEPLDGWFAFGNGDSLSVLGIFGLHPGRAGFTAVEVSGPRPEGLARSDGSALFSGTLPGAERAGLASIVGAEEMLELAWRLSS